RHEASDQALELPFVAGARKMGVTHVVGEIEAPIVHPHRLAERGGRLEALAVAREAMEARLHQAPHALDLDSALRRYERTALEHRGGGDVHVADAVLDLEEAVVECREPFEVGVRHAPLLSPSGEQEPSPSNHAVTSTWSLRHSGSQECSLRERWQRAASPGRPARSGTLAPFRFVRWSFRFLRTRAALGRSRLASHAGTRTATGEEEFRMRRHVVSPTWLRCASDRAARW